MKRQIVVEIDCEDEQFCGECRCIIEDSDDFTMESVSQCALFPDGDCYMRDSRCLSAEKRLRDLVEAGEAMKHDLNTMFGEYRPSADAWDRAVKALEEGR